MPVSTISVIRIPSIVITCYLLGFLTILTVQHLLKLYRNRKIANILMALQLVLVTLRNLTVVLSETVQSVECLGLTKTGWMIYHFWVISSEVVLALRSIAFITNRKFLLVFKAILAMLWTAKLGTAIYQTNTIVQVSAPGEFCGFFADFAIGDAQLGIKLATEVVILLAFVAKAIEMIVMTRGQLSGDNNKWFVLSVNNSLVTRKSTF
jgi:hypothetical protein